MAVTLPMMQNSGTRVELWEGGIPSHNAKYHIVLDVKRFTVDMCLCSRGTDVIGCLDHPGQTFESYCTFLVVRFFTLNTVLKWLIRYMCMLSTWMHKFQTNG